MKLLSIPCVFVVILACNQTNESAEESAGYATVGNIERLDSTINDIISPDAVMEVIAEGFEWSEGPLWVEREQLLLFSDVPTNTIYKWTEENGSAVYLKPSGYSGEGSGGRKEPGSNGLVLDNDGNLIICQHGNRQVARMDAPMNQPEATFVALADRYEGKRLSSPNDVVYNEIRELFFTDPPYGLPTQSDDDPDKEIAFNGVYKVQQDGKVVLLTDKISKPNGIAFFPGEEKLLIGSSDPSAADWYVLDLSEDEIVPQLFYSATNDRNGVAGLPDGLKIDRNGTVYASGPGGVWVFDSDGRVLGKVRLDDAVSNVALSTDEKTLYITNSGRVLRLKMR